jgi:hypothetical protein
MSPVETNPLLLIAIVFGLCLIALIALAIVASRNNETW